MSEAVAPADGCPNCLANAQRGVSAAPSAVCRGIRNLLALYDCPGCGHTWTCWWSLEALRGEAAA